MLSCHIRGVTACHGVGPLVHLVTPLYQVKSNNGLAHGPVSAKYDGLSIQTFGQKNNTILCT